MYIRIEKVDSNNAIGYKEIAETINTKELRLEKKRIKARLEEINAILQALGETI